MTEPTIGHALTATALPPSIDVTVTFEDDDVHEVHVSVPVEGIVRPGYAANMVRGILRIFDLGLTEMERLMREGAHGTLITRSADDEPTGDRLAHLRTGVHHSMELPDDGQAPGPCTYHHGCTVEARV